MAKLYLGHIKTKGHSKLVLAAAQKLGSFSFGLAVLRPIVGSRGTAFNCSGHFECQILFCPYNLAERLGAARECTPASIWQSALGISSWWRRSDFFLHAANTLLFKATSALTTGCRGM